MLANFRFRFSYFFIYLVVETAIFYYFAASWGFLEAVFAYATKSIAGFVFMGFCNGRYSLDPQKKWDTMALILQPSLRRTFYLLFLAIALPGVLLTTIVALLVLIPGLSQRLVEHFFTSAVEQAVSQSFGQDRSLHTQTESSTEDHQSSDSQEKEIIEI